MKDISLLDSFYEYQKQLKLLSTISGILERDQETYMPDEAGLVRSEQLSLIEKIYHNVATNVDYIHVVDELVLIKDTLSQKDSRLVHLAHQTIQKQRLLSEEFVQKYSALKSQSQHIWVQAKNTNNFSIFKPYLEQIIEMTRQYALSINPRVHPYDTLLGEYEEGMSMKIIDTLFAELKPVLASIEHSPVIKRESYIHPDQGKVKDLMYEIIQSIGFNKKRGTMAHTEHPFETTLGPCDVRIQVNYSKPLLEVIYSTIHELGHGLYEQNVDGSYSLTELQSGVSMGIHESQSRLLENIIGRSYEFCVWLHSLFMKYDITYRSTPDQLYQDVNHIQNNPIRICSDEVTYNYHIMMRYEIERDLIGGSLSVDDIPRVWSDKMYEYLGIRPINDQQGCLQDVHWSVGLFGYFPTYILGNFYGAQMYQQFTMQYPDFISESILKGDFTSYIQWHTDNLRSHGSLYTPIELLHRISGDGYNSRAFIDYITKKYLAS